jgi:hypothetical protein
VDGRCPRWVKLRRTQCEQVSSELPLIADIAQYSRHVSKVPTSDIEMKEVPRERAFVIDGAQIQELVLRLDRVLPTPALIQELRAGEFAAGRQC